MRLLVTDDKFHIHRLPSLSEGWQLEFNYRDSAVKVRPVLPGEPLTPIFQLIYEVHVEEQKVLPASALTNECRIARAKWDEWDFLASTRHYITLADGEEIGHARIVNDSDLGLPLEKTGFDLCSERLRGHGVCEFSKLVIRRSYRGSPVLSAITWQIHQQKKVQEKQSCIHLSCDPAFVKVYSHMGATEIGTFHSNEFDAPYAAMRMDFAPTFNEHAIDGPRIAPPIDLGTIGWLRSSRWSNVGTTIITQTHVTRVTGRNGGRSIRPIWQFDCLAASSSLDTVWSNLRGSPQAAEDVSGVRRFGGHLG